jgi:hypothetical protein
VSVRGTELMSTVMPVASGYLPYHLLLLFSSFAVPTPDACHCALQS